MSEILATYIHGEDRWLVGNILENITFHHYTSQGVTRVDAHFFVIDNASVDDAKNEIDRLYKAMHDAVELYWKYEENE